MLEGLLTYADAGQAIIVTPFLLMGAMAPVSTPAALPSRRPRRWRASRSFSSCDRARLA